MPRCLAAALFAVIVFAAATQPASAASFDCGRAYTALEKAVCADSRLSALDEQMAENYLGLLRRVSGRTESAAKAEQKTWLKRRNACGTDERCISSEYRARIKRIAELAAGEGLIVEPKRSAERDAPPPARSIFQPATRAAATDPTTTAAIRTTADRASAPGPTTRIASPRPDGTIDQPEEKSPGLLKRMLTRVAPNLMNRDSEPVAAANTRLETPPAVREEPQVRVTRRDDKVRRNTSVLPSEPQYDEPASEPAPRKIKVVKRRPSGTPEPAIEDAAPQPTTIEEDAPVAFAPPEKKVAKSAKDESDPGAPAVLLYTTPDVSTVIRLPDGESPFDKLDAQRAFEEPPPAPVRVLKATPEVLPQPSKRAFDARRFDAFDTGRFDAFNDPPNG